MIGVTDSAGSEPSSGLQARRIARMIALPGLVLLGYAAWVLLPTWLSLLWDQVPGPIRGILVSGLLNGLMVAYGLTLTAALVGLPALVAAAARSPGLLRRRPGLARLMLLLGSCLFSLAGLELATATWMGWLHREPDLPAVRPLVVEAREDLPTHFAPKAGPAAGGPLRLLVIGESSGRGEPYHPWLSVGQVAGWQIERALGRPVQVDVWATGGAILETMHQRLAVLSYRPDVLIVFAGHNEFWARYWWDRNAPHYLDERPGAARASAVETALRRSPFCRLILETLDLRKVNVSPPKQVTRELVDRPVCTPEERAERLADFGRRLEAIASYCEAIGTLPVVIVPASNDGDFEPSRSILPASATPDVRRAFAAEFRRAHDLEASEPATAVAAYRRLLERAPGFAETHYRLARLLEQSGRFAEARVHYILARETDALPIRCPDDFRRAQRELAGRHPGLILVDSERVLGPLCPHGILDDHAYHDAQHPTFRGYLALAQDLVNQLHHRRALGWPGSVPAPAIDPDECARHFGLDAARWAEVCNRSSLFYQLTAFVRYDPTDRQERERRYNRARERISAGTPPERAGVTGLGIHPSPSPSPSP